jgi:hypothetical protein
MPSPAAFLSASSEPMKTFQVRSSHVTRRPEFARRVREAELKLVPVVESNLGSSQPKRKLLFLGIRRSADNVKDARCQENSVAPVASYFDKNASLHEFENIGLGRRIGHMQPL